MNTLRSGNRVPACSAAASKPTRNGVAPAMWVQRSAVISATRHVRVPTFHQNRRGAQQQRAFEGIDGSADVGDRRRDQEHVAVINQPVVADLRDQCVDRIMACAERPSAGLWCPTCRGSSARRPGSSTGRPVAPVSVNSDAYGVWRPGVAPHHHYLGRRGHR